ncbi:MAG TPA: hypothetical protein VFJ79_02605, partial [Acidimicrobiales bacterium]|nr:hypothetical protein [Acidimicrobiales bacterium]
MARNGWEIRTRAIVEAEPAAVAAWYTAKERWDEQVRAVSDRGASELTEREWEADGKRHRELSWTCNHGKPGSLRFETLLGPQGVLLPTDRGFEVRREQATQSHRSDGRRLLITSRSVFEFKGLRNARGAFVDLTEVTAVHQQLVVGGPWFEKYLPPVSSRRQHQRQADEVA